LKPKKKKRKKRKKLPPKPRSAIDVARNPRPYQFNLYTPPFPSIIYHQPKANAVSQNVANTFRNIQAVNAKELERLRGDFTAYRQESQTIFKKLIAFPKERAMVEEQPPSPIESPEDLSIDETSIGEKTLMEQAGEGAGRLTEPETKITLPIRNPEDELPSRRKYQRKNKSMAMLKRELQSENISFPSKIKAKELRQLAQDNGISIQL
tara:strand:+ start:573 stop:1196 length:624 start_codon:yes stop_codon:yes gene_type:complete